MQNAGRTMSRGRQCKTMGEEENCFFVFFQTRPALFFFSDSVGRRARWNKTDVIVASGTHFAWLWILTVSSNSTKCLHGSQLGFVTQITLP